MRIISRWTLDLGWVLEHEFFPLAGGSWLYHPAKECVVWKMFFAAFDCPRTGWEGHVWHTPPIILERNCFADLAHWLGWQFVARFFFVRAMFGTRIYNKCYILGRGICGVYLPWWYGLILVWLVTGMAWHWFDPCLSILWSRGNQGFLEQA